MDTKRILDSVVLAIAVILVSDAVQASGGTERKTLAKLDGAFVLVESLPEVGKAAGLVEADIQTLIELRLRQVGIRVLTEEECIHSVRGPTLYVNIGAARPEGMALLAYSINVDLQQNAWIDVVPKILAAGAKTWGVGRVGLAGTSVFRSVVQEGVGELVDTFCNEYLAANPRPQQAPK